MIDKKNHELGVHKDKIWAESSTGDPPNIPKLIQPTCTNQPMIWDIFEKSSHQMSIVHVLGNGLTKFFQIQNK